MEKPPCQMFHWVCSECTSDRLTIPGKIRKCRQFMIFPWKLVRKNFIGYQIKNLVLLFQPQSQYNIIIYVTVLSQNFIEVFVILFPDIAKKRDKQFVHNILLLEIFSEIERRVS